MRKLLTSSLLTVAAVPFLMAAPSATKKVQNTSTASTAKPKTHKKHTKKTATDTASSNTNSATPKK